MMGYLNSFCNLSFFRGGSMFIGLLILAGILLLVFWPKKLKNDKDQTALEILKERLARGEINVEEFEQLKNKISI